MQIKNIHGIYKNTCCLYVMQNTSSMTFPTTWYGDIIYSDHVVRMHVFEKRKLHPRRQQTPPAERYRNLLRKEDLR